GAFLFLRGIRLSPKAPFFTLQVPQKPERFRFIAMGSNSVQSGANPAFPPPKIFHVRIIDATPPLSKLPTLEVSRLRRSKSLPAPLLPVRRDGTGREMVQGRSHGPTA